jgi:hypothetical protein
MPENEKDRTEENETESFDSVAEDLEEKTTLEEVIKRRFGVNIDNAISLSEGIVKGLVNQTINTGLYALMFATLTVFDNAKKANKKHLLENYINNLRTFFEMTLQEESP